MSTYRFAPFSRKAFLIGAAAVGVKLCPFLNRCPVRVDGLCNRTAPSRRRLDNGGEILCHHDSAHLLNTQQGVTTIVTGWGLQEGAQPSPQLRQAQIQAQVDLFRALGGDWTVNTAPVTP